MEKSIEDKIRKSNEAIKAAKLLLENDFCNEAINRIYYACFYVVSALLLKNDIDARSHNGIKTMFRKIFIQHNVISEKVADFYSSVFSYKDATDYNDNKKYEKAVVNKVYNEAIIFIKHINELLTKP